MGKLIKLSRSDYRLLFSAPVLVAAAGYFVDIYDLTLFSIVRVTSLRSLGLEGDALLEKGVLLINAQMIGMLVGGVLWGILGDRRGRLSVLFGSILTYSLANIANGFAQTIEQYTLLRFIAGVGLAGELGAGITLVAEVLPKHLRGYGTAIVATIGVSGAVVGGMLGSKLDWRVSFFVGGGLGLILLLLRASVFESELFTSLQKRGTVARGAFLKLLSYERRGRFLRCILIGVPIWYVIGILVTFSPEFGLALGVQGVVIPGTAIAANYVGFVLGDFSSGVLSQGLRSRKKIVLTYLGVTALITAVYLALGGWTLTQFYSLCGLLGFGAGYWAVFVTIAAEQFGTNLRATAATSVPNFVRGSTVLMTLLFSSLKGPLGLLGSAAATGAVVFLVAVLALRGLPETHHKDLDYLEI